MREYFVYILKCNDDSYYTGVTNNLERRIQEHNKSSTKSSYTFSRRPLILVWKKSFNNINEAIQKDLIDNLERLQSVLQLFTKEVNFHLLESYLLKVEDTLDELQTGYGLVNEDNAAVIFFFLGGELKIIKYSSTR